MLWQKGHPKGDELDRVIDRQPVISAYKPHGMPEWAYQLTTDRAKYLSEKSGGLYNKNWGCSKNRFDRRPRQRTGPSIIP